MITTNNNGNAKRKKHFQNEIMCDNMIYSYEF